MAETNKAILEKANAAIARGDFEGFLQFCTDDTVWIFIGERTLVGKAAVREYMQATYKEPPSFHVEHMIAEGDSLAALGEITLKDEKGQATRYAYCDVWRFRDGKMAELRAFVVPPEA
nr:nuclear transport factor 2 family protein [uncultured Caldimonas sp.]